MIELVFGIDIGTALIVLYGNSGISKDKDISLWNLVPNSEFSDFSAFVVTTSRCCTCCQHSSTDDHTTTDASLSHPPLFRLQRDGQDAARRAGSSATAERC